MRVRSMLISVILASVGGAGTARAVEPGPACSCPGCSCTGKPPPAQRPRVTCSVESWGERAGRQSADPTRLLIRGLPAGSRARLYLERPTAPIDCQSGQCITRRGILGALKLENVWQTDSASLDARGELSVLKQEGSPVAPSGITRVLPVNAAYTLAYETPDGVRGEVRGRVGGSAYERSQKYAGMQWDGHSSRQVTKPLTQPLAAFRGWEWRPGATYTEYEKVWTPVYEISEKGGNLAPSADLFLQRKNVRWTPAFIAGSGKMVVRVAGIAALPRSTPGSPVEFEIINEGTGEKVTGRTTSNGSFAATVPVVGMRRQPLKLRAFVKDATSGVVSELLSNLGEVRFSADTAGPVTYAPLDVERPTFGLPVSIRGRLTDGRDL